MGRINKLENGEGMWVNSSILLKRTHNDEKKTEMGKKSDAKQFFTIGNAKKLNKYLDNSQIKLKFAFVNS